MRKFRYILLLILLFLSCTIKVRAADDRYFAKVDSLEQAKEVTKIVGGELISFNDNIAIIEIKKETIVEDNPYMVKYSNGNSNNGKPLDSKIITTSNGDVLLEQDGYCKPASLGIGPYSNEYYDPYIKYDFDDIGWFGAYYNNIKGKGSIVAVLDTGCQTTHPDLSGQIYGTYNAIDGSTNVTDTDGHGTHVSGIIAAKDNDIGIIGVAPEAKLFIVKVDSSNGSWYYSDIIKGLNKCIELGNIDVINISGGGYYYSELFEDAIKDCVNHGILIVSAAGNEATEIPCYPSAFGYGLRVAAITSVNNSLYWYSNYGSSNANIAAPGDEVISAYNNDYVFLSGTSMAAPFVSGAAALICGERDFAKNASGANAIRDIILSSKDNKIYSNSMGHQVQGCLNISNIFAVSVKRPKAPRFKITREKDTGQCYVTITGEGTIYYCIDDGDPIYDGKKYTGPVRIDGQDGMYEIIAVCVNSKGISNENTRDITMPDEVISQKKLESVELYIDKINKKKIYSVYKDKKYKIKIENIGKNIKANKFKWSSNNRLVKVDKNGKITISNKIKKGTKVTIKAKLGTVIKKINLLIKR